MPSKSAAEELGAIPVDAYQEPSNSAPKLVAVPSNAPTKAAPSPSQDPAAALGAVPTDKWVERGGPTTVQQAFPTTTGGALKQISEVAGRPVDAIQDFIGRLQRGDEIGDSLHKAAQQLNDPGFKDKGITYEDILTKAQTDHGVHPELAKQSAKFMAPVMRVVSDPTNALMFTDALKAIRPAAAGAEAIEGAEGAAKIMGKAGNVIEPAAKEAGDLSFAQARTLGATFQHSKRALKELATTRDLVEAADILRQGNDPVVQFGSSVEQIRKRASQAASKTWDDVEAIYRAADMKANGKAIDGKEIADNIRQRAAAIEPTGQNQKVIEAMNAEADYLEKKGPMSLGHAQDVKNNYLYKPTKAETHVLGLDGNNQIRDAFNEAMYDSLTRQDPKLADAWKQKMSEYGIYAAASGAATDKAIANISNRFLSLTDYMAGGVGALAKPESIPQTVQSAALAAANHLARTRGGSAAAVIAEKANNVVKTGKILGVPVGTILNKLERYPGISNEIYRQMTGSNNSGGDIAIKDPKAIEEAATAISNSDLPSTTKATMLHKIHTDGELSISVPPPPPPAQQAPGARMKTIQDAIDTIRQSMPPQ